MDRTVWRPGAAASFCAALALAARVPEPLAVGAGAAPVFGTAGSVGPGPAGSAVMILTGGIDEADGRKMSLRNGRPGGLGMLV